MLIEIANVGILYCDLREKNQPFTSEYGEGNGNPFQYSCLEKPMDGEAWQATVHGFAKSRIRLSNFTFTFTMGIPRWLRGKECRRHRFNPWVGKIPWRRKWQPTPVLLPGESRGPRNLVGNSLQGLKKSDMTE